MYKHVLLEMTTLVQLYLHCLQMKANICSWNICWVFLESILQLTTFAKINLAQKQNFNHLWLNAMHWCGNALTAAQEIESAHVPFSMLGNWTKTTISWIWLFATGNRTIKLNSWNNLEIWNNSFSYATCLWQPRYFVLLFIANSSAISIGRSREHLSFAGFTVGNSIWSHHHTVALCDRQVFVVVTFFHLPELWP